MLNDPDVLPDGGENFVAGIGKKLRPARIIGHNFHRQAVTHDLIIHPEELIRIGILLICGERSFKQGVLFLSGFCKEK